MVTAPEVFDVPDELGAVERVAAWVRARGGSCTSPLALSNGMELAFRMQTVDGAVAVHVGDRITYDGAGFRVTRWEDLPCP